MKQLSELDTSWVYDPEIMDRAQKKANDFYKSIAETVKWKSMEARLQRDMEVSRGIKRSLAYLLTTPSNMNVANTPLRNMNEIAVRELFESSPRKRKYEKRDFDEIVHIDKIRRFK